jgi:para-nitrobenzyl esterase
MQMFFSKLTCGVPALLLVLATSAIVSAQIPKTMTQSGAISGVSENGLAVYKGVPFASPPIGDLRWRPPTQAAPWIGVRKADFICSGVYAGGRVHAGRGAAEGE